MLFRVNKLFNHDQVSLLLDANVPTDIEIIPEYFSDFNIQLQKLKSPLIFTFKFQIGGLVNAYLSFSNKFPRPENSDKVFKKVTTF